MRKERREKWRSKHTSCRPKQSSRDLSSYSGTSARREAVSETLSTCSNKGKFKDVHLGYLETYRRTCSRWISWKLRENKPMHFAHSSFMKKCSVVSSSTASKEQTPTWTTKKPMNSTCSKSRWPTSVKWGSTSKKNRYARRRKECCSRSSKQSTNKTRCSSPTMVSSSISSSQPMTSSMHKIISSSWRKDVFSKSLSGTKKAISNSNPYMIKLLRKQGHHRSSSSSSCGEPNSCNQNWFHHICKTKISIESHRYFRRW